MYNGFHDTSVVVINLEICSDEVPGFNCLVPFADSPLGRQRCPVHPASSHGLGVTVRVRVHLHPVAAGCGRRWPTFDGLGLL